MSTYLEERLGFGDGDGGVDLEFVDLGGSVGSIRSGGWECSVRRSPEPTRARFP